MSAIAEQVARLERAGSPPPRTELQRLRALERANQIRAYRAGLKRDLKAGRVDVVELLIAEPVDERIATMKIFDLLLGMPKRGRVRTNELLRRERISPSRTIAGLSPRQRHALVARLRHDRARPTLFDDAGAYATPAAAGGLRSGTAASGEET